MESNNVNQNIQKAFTEDEESSFDIMEWVLHFLHHWYLFVIGIIISLGLAYLVNRKWLPEYKSAGTMIIEEYRSSGNTQALMQGFGVQAGYKNVSNQVIMLGSNDLISKVVDSLPQLKVDYISIGNFKTRNLYNTSPITIQHDYIASEAYNLLFKIKLNINSTYTITVDDNKQYENFSLEGRLGEPLQHNLFFITVYNTHGYTGKNELYFRFRDKGSLVDDFTSRLGFNFLVEASSVLEISLRSQVPDRDVDFINMLCATFLSENLDRKNDAAYKTIEFIDNQLAKVSESLSESEGEMTSFRQKNQIFDMSSHTGQLLGKATKFDNDFAALRLRETYFDYLTNYLKTNFESGSVIAPSSLGLNEPMLMSLVQQINDLNMKRSVIPEQNPYYAKYTKEIVSVKTAINEVTKNMRAALEIEKNDVKSRFSKVQRDINTLPQDELDMISLERRYKMDDNYYTFFLQKRAEAEILKSSNSPDNSVLDKARVMALTNGSTKSKNTMTYFLFGLLIPALIVVLKIFLNTSVRSPKDVEKGSKYQLIGMVRHTQSNDPLLVSKNPRSSFTEMFRVIRTRIEFLLKRKNEIMIMVTSGESGDGKTYFCINLAGIYSMTNKKTILVDMDIRKPSILKRFDIDESQGITNYLIGQAKLEDVILKLPDVDYDILPAGPVPPNAGELIRSEKLAEMFEILRKKYDYIIVDTSPIGVVADAYSLASLSDINLFVVRNNKTNKAFLRKITNQLMLDKMSNFYTILNDISVEENRYSKYYSKKYTYGYGYGYGYGYTSAKSKKKKAEAEKYFQYYQDDREI